MVTLSNRINESCYTNFIVLPDQAVTRHVEDIRKEKRFDEKEDYLKMSQLVHMVTPI